ncbi:DNA polymerase II [Shewanella sedimentimangrovi]|uniref:DNA polymerase n=1 Tax=Shewanella sedimentimangrovi TaxID=2814293 RepID=A0ABX7R4T3_9GAMM|nr:DNA polymerase II [Shewanella sedimentimangrovi]QSX38494.1 DNA polymerase II [Shewanella sedimentimangrovi]
MSVPGNHHLSSPVTSVISGRILTRANRLEQGQSVLEYYVATAQGPVQVIVRDQPWLAFCHQQDALQLKRAVAQAGGQIKPLSLKSFEGQAVSALYSASARAHRQVRRMATDMGIRLFEDDIRPEQRFLIERFVALDAEFSGYEVECLAGVRRFEAQRVRCASQDPGVSLKAVSVDLECSMQGELYSIGFFGDVAPLVIMVGQAGEARAAPSDCDIQWASDEKALLEAIIAWFAAADPDIIIGWSIVGFDLSLLSRRAQHHGLSLTIGRGGSELGWKVADKHRPETLDLPGRVVLDGIDWLKAAFFQFDSFSLQSVASALLGKGKAIDKVDDRGEEITRLFLEDKPALARYNLMDCQLVWEIFAHTHLFEFALERARLTGLELGRVGASVAAFTHLYLPHLHRQGYVAPAMGAVPGQDSPGGYVMDSLPGLYRNILVLDFKSLYPSIIRSFLIDPKGLIEGLQESEQDSVPGFRGARFSRKQPILPGIIATLAARREEAKRDGNAPLSQAIKIIMNSLYGVLGSSGCVFHDTRLASSITLRGHEIMRQTRAWIEELGYQVIYGDTDSTFVWLGDEAADADATGKMLVNRVNGLWRDRLWQEWQLESFLELEYERHYRHFFMPTLRHSAEGSKKRYVGEYDDHGQSRIVFKGMEQVRSDWSPLAKRLQHELYRRLFAGEDMVAYIKDNIDALFKGDLDDELVFRKRLRRKLVDYSASAPHVKAARALLESTGDPVWGQRGARIEYVMTTQGAEPLQLSRQPIDYEYYLEKQIRPIVDPVFSVLDINYSEMLGKQLLLI